MLSSFFPVFLGLPGLLRGIGDVGADNGVRETSAMQDRLRRPVNFFHPPLREDRSLPYRR
jgi:hypothetical protein